MELYRAGSSAHSPSPSVSSSVSSEDESCPPCEYAIWLQCVPYSQVGGSSLCPYPPVGVDARGMPRHPMRRLVGHCGVVAAQTDSYIAHSGILTAYLVCLWYHVAAQTDSFIARNGCYGTFGVLRTVAHKRTTISSADYLLTVYSVWSRTSRHRGVRVVAELP